MAPNQNPFQVLLIYSLLMITFPVTSFFVSKTVVENIFNVSSNQSYIYATAVSVISIHIILAMFVYKAYNEDKPYAIEKID